VVGGGCGHGQRKGCDGAKTPQNAGSRSQFRDGRTRRGMDGAPRAGRRVEPGLRTGWLGNSRTSRKARPEATLHPKTAATWPRLSAAKAWPGGDIAGRLFAARKGGYTCSRERFDRLTASKPAPTVQAQPVPRQRFDPTARAAPMMPASLLRAAGTKGARLRRWRCHFSGFRLTPPPRMISSGQSRPSTSFR